MDKLKMWIDAVNVAKDILGVGEDEYVPLLDLSAFLNAHQDGIERLLAGDRVQAEIEENKRRIAELESMDSKV